MDCSGKSICEVNSESSTSSYEFRKSVFLDGFLAYSYYIPLNIATVVLSEKLGSISLTWAKKRMDDADEYWWLYSLRPK